jgi:hypothetical protein
MSYKRGDVIQGGAFPVVAPRATIKKGMQLYGGEVPNYIKLKPPAGCDVAPDCATIATIQQRLDAAKQRLAEIVTASRSK